jgi:2-methylcitrate dehydratase PrpD
MEIEKGLAAYVTNTQFEDFPPEVIEVVKNQVLGVLGTAIAGARQDGCKSIVAKVRDWGGKEEASILMYGGRVPVHNAVFANSLLARALDFDDAIAPGVHVGASTVISALAVSESLGGRSGKEFLTAIALGAEIAGRLNLEEQQYDGWDPTGFCGTYAVSALTSKLQRLDETQTHHAMGIAFTSVSGSLQSNIDGALTARLIQGFASREGVIASELAAAGITGPVNFIEGVWGHVHLYGKDNLGPLVGLKDLGVKYELMKTMFKKYPSCAGTFGSTDLILAFVKDLGLKADDIDHIDIQVTPYLFNMVGQPFKIGKTPRVSAQFNIRYCVANALLRGQPKLEHFEPSKISDTGIMTLAERISVSADASLEKISHTAAHMQVTMKSGEVHSKTVDIASGFPGNPLKKDDHVARFWDCVGYAGEYYPRENGDRIFEFVSKLEQIEDVRTVLSLLQANQAL